MKTIKRLLILLLLLMFVLPPILFWKFPDTTLRKAHRLIEKYRSGKAGDFIIDSSGDWKFAARGLDVKEIKVRRGKEFFPLKLTILRFETKLFDFKVCTIATDDIPKSPITAVLEQNGAYAVINGSFFNPELGILGLAISDGEEISKQTIAGENRGIFFVRYGRPGLVHRDSFYREGVKQALQSGPWLVYRGKAQTTFKREEHVNRRSAIGMDKKGRVYFIITDTVANGITLPHLAKIMADRLGCHNALNLDGGTSSQMLLSTGVRTILVRGFVNVPDYIAALPKEGKK
jgi:hypothetical protein